MTTTLPISKVMLSLANVPEKLGLQVSLAQEFFSEWQRDLPELTAFEVQQIDRSIAGKVCRTPRSGRSGNSG